MKISPAKENILKRIRQALSNPVPVPFPKSEGSNSVYKPSSEDLEIQFAEEFTKLLGKFAFCVNEDDLINQLKKLLREKKWDNIYCNEENLFHIISKSAPYQIDPEKKELSNSTLADCDASITTCEYLIARTGSMVLSSAQQSGRTVSVYAPVHICIA
jgi:L-lactate dehydrogenase complex protein LldG